MWVILESEVTLGFRIHWGRDHSGIWDILRWEVVGIWGILGREVSLRSEIYWVGNHFGIRVVSLSMPCALEAYVIQQINRVKCCAGHTPCVSEETLLPGSRPALPDL